ncbi:MAG: hypothetical protein EHM77_08150 [Planctomycetaceae bacterium]|nr:MAG: hypothetical protein EHM77_08150 [Planctomycetaceae bacterium]
MAAEGLLGREHSARRSGRQRNPPSLRDLETLGLAHRSGWTASVVVAFEPLAATLGCECDRQSDCRPRMAGLGAHCLLQSISSPAMGQFARRGADRF